MRDDLRNLTLIVVSAGAAVLMTGALVSAAFDSEWEVRVLEPEVVEISFEGSEILQPLEGTNRLFASVRTRDGRAMAGFVRWDRNEGSLADVLDADRPRDGGGVNRSGIRFGHIDRIEVDGDDEATLVLKSGERVHLRGRSTDLGSGLRALVVDDPVDGPTELSWDEVAEVDFIPAPRDPRPDEGRLWGTVETHDGRTFTGFVAWDTDEIYTSDVLDGDIGGKRLRIPFGAIHTIERAGRRAARVTLHSGESFTLRGTNDVNSSIRGIAVSDPALGEVVLEWSAFRRVTFGAPQREISPADFDGGRPLHGTVVTEDGTSYSGRVVWDADEAYTWELLNGEDKGGVTYKVEFGHIARIEKWGDGARVTLRDGRVLELEDSNDVDGGNRGILVEDGSRVVRIPWDEFRELRLRG